MAKKQKEPKVEQYTVRARLEYEANVTVEATSKEEAETKFKDLQWVHEQPDGLMNWEAIGEFEVDR